MSSRASQKVAVLKGGFSAEREVSLSSGHECAAALRGEGFTVVEIDAARDLAAQLAQAAPDVVFNALHGRWGEDGCVQGLLEWIGIPYTHSGVMASSVAMDKQRSKEVFANIGLPVAHGVLASRKDIEADHVIEPPYVVKPYNEGSSVGVYIVHEHANGPPKLAPELPDIMMAESFVRGRELTTAVLDGRPLGVTDIITDGWYDYDAEYKPGGSRHVIPADIPKEIEDACKDYALRAHNALGCRGVSRADFRWDDTKGRDGLIILEVNTQPGMTPTSLVPEQAEACGYSFGELCAWLVEDASCHR